VVDSTPCKPASRTAWMWTGKCWTAHGIGHGHPLCRSICCCDWDCPFPIPTATQTPPWLLTSSMFAAAWPVDACVHTKCGQKECTVAMPPTLHSPFPPWQPASRCCQLVQPCTRRRCHGRRRRAWRWRRCRRGSSRRRNCTLPHHIHRPPAVFRATDARHAGHEATGERLARRAGLVWVFRGWCAHRGRRHVESKRQVGLLGRVPIATRRELD